MQYKSIGIFWYVFEHEYFLYGPTTKQYRYDGSSLVCWKAVVLYSGGHDFR